MAMAVGRSVVGPECFLAPLRLRVRPHPLHICVVALDRRRHRRRLNKSIGAAAGEAVSAKRAGDPLRLVSIAPKKLN